MKLLSNTYHMCIIATSLSILAYMTGTERFLNNYCLAILMLHILLRPGGRK